MPNLLSSNTSHASFIYKTLDWIPVISTGANLVHIFARSCFRIDPNSSYGMFLKERVIFDHVFLALPIINLFYSVLRCICPYDREYYLKAVQNDGLILRHASRELKNDREVVLAAVKQNGLALGLASIALRNDPEIVIEAVKQDFFALRYASYALITNRGFLLRAVKQNPKIVMFNPSFVSRIEFLPTDERRYLRSTWDSRLTPDLYHDRAFILEAVEENGLILKYVTDASPFHRPPVFIYDREIIFAAVKQNGLALGYAMRLDREIVLAAVKQNGLALKFASHDLRYDWQTEFMDFILQSEYNTDPEIVREAVKQNGLALQFVPKFSGYCLSRIENGSVVKRFGLRPSLRSNFKICSHAISQNKQAYQFVNPDMRSLFRVLTRVKEPQAASRAYGALSIVLRNGF